MKQKFGGITFMQSCRVTVDLVVNIYVGYTHKTLLNARYVDCFAWLYEQLYVLAELI